MTPPMKTCGFHLAKHPAISRFLLFCMGLALTVVAGTALAAQYEYPTDLPQRMIKPFMESAGTFYPHDACLRTGKVSGKHKLHAGAKFEWHFRASDGTDIACRSGLCHDGDGYYASERIPFNDAKIGDVFFVYFFYQGPNEPWVSHEMAIKCGGRGHHANCNKCFKLISLELAKNTLKTQATSTGAKPMEMERRGGITHEPSRPRPMLASQWQNRTDEGDDPVNDEEEVGQSDYWMPAMREYRPGKMIPDRDTIIYSLRALPREEMMGTLKAGIPVYVMEDVGGGFVRVRFITSDGKRYEGAAKKSELGFSEP